MKPFLRLYNKIFVILVWASLLLPIVTIDTCSNCGGSTEETVQVNDSSTSIETQSNGTESNDEKLPPEIATYYGYQILLAFPPTVYQLDETTQEYEPLATQSKGEDFRVKELVYLESILFGALLFSMICIMGLNRKSPKQEYTVYMKGLFASLGLQVYLILETYLTDLYFTYIEREIGGHLLYLGIFGLLISLYILSREVPAEELAEVKMNKSFQLYFILIWIMFGCYLLGTILLNLYLMFMFTMGEVESSGLVGIVAALSFIPPLFSKYLFYYFQKRHYLLVKDSTNRNDIFIWGVPTILLTLIGVLMLFVYIGLFNSAGV